MYDLMQGVRVVEVAEHTFAPASGMILADWGADVVKVERVQGAGDPARHMTIPGTGGNRSPYFEAANRGKRSIALDLNQAAGREVLYELVSKADVFITNLRAAARNKLGIEAEQLMAINPRLIYTRATGYGLRGAMADDGGFDFPTAWCRTGAAYMQSNVCGEPPIQPASIGDLTGGATLAGAISAALFRRERTGKGAIVDNALYLVGAYLMSQTLIAASLGNPIPPVPPQSLAHNALLNMYRTADERWIYICLLMEKWWPDFVRHIGHPELADDPRFSTAADRANNNDALISIIGNAFATRTYEDWCVALKTMEGVWAPVQSPQEVLADTQAVENNFVTPVMDDDGLAYLAGASPAQFDGQPIGELKASPAYGAHGDDILRQAGFSDERIAALRSANTLY